MAAGNRRAPNPHADFAREVWPFVLALVVALLLATYMPWLALWLPNLVMPAK
jgi:TRAP-type C4-dicarboxylate transport system permease large subunit